MKKQYFFTLILPLALLACNPAEDQSTDSEQARPPSSWIEERVGNTEERLSSTEAGQKVWQAIKAHGGLQNWYANGPLRLHFNYQPLNDATPRNTLNVADTWSARARQYMAVDTSRQFGWDGQQAWAKPDTSAIPFDARFWALTPYYFVSIPFVLADEGVFLEDFGLDTLDNQPYELVKATFGEGVGDAPDDFYVIYMHPENHQLGAMRYVVSYPAYFPEGGHTPEKIMVFKDLQTVDGITLPTGYRTHMWQSDSVGEYVTDITVSDVEFLPELPDSYFEVLEDAQLI